MKSYRQATLRVQPLNLKFLTVTAISSSTARPPSADVPREALIGAVNETEEDDIRDALRDRNEEQRALEVPGPRLLKDTVAHRTTVDTDDTEELRALRADGTLVTETRRTRQQEQLGDQELPEDEAKSLASNESRSETKGGRERRARLEAEQRTELMAGGRRLATHTHSRTRTEEAEREGQPVMDENWDSLSVRMRRQRRLRHNGMSYETNHLPQLSIRLDRTMIGPRSPIIVLIV
ncbi:hypothetical protein EVAR_56759_1 [Eumeta japonica]|uniref:Uncharacterized protein n=1 Tax=Eumeta variegata TaxID=151549 RepID=A0A4C1XR94_EUMVA|nr:hypothetical protein EVAR_56759_1 [Eumeta japonica]